MKKTKCPVCHDRGFVQTIRGRRGGGRRCPKIKAIERYLTRQIELVVAQKTNVKPIPKEPMPNKTEARFKEHFIRMYPGGDRPRFAAITLRIGRRRYTPDWSAMMMDENGNMVLHFWEVKGPYIHEDSAVKFDLFKSHFHEFQFCMMQEQDREWRQIR